MSRNRYQPSPFRDRYGLGFRLPGGPAPLERHRTITAVCWDGDEAQFVNAAGLVVPCKAGDVLRSQLTRASHREFGKIVGGGQFAMKPHVLKAMESAGTLRKWVLYHFSLCECWFYDDSAAWDAHVQADLDELNPEYFREIAEVERKLKQRQQRFNDWQCIDDDFAPDLPDLPTPEALKERHQQAIAKRRAELHEQRRQALEQDQQLGTWLRGELPTPPLLRSIA